MTTIVPPDEVSLDDFDLSDPDFWTSSRSFREGAFKALRDEPGLIHFDEREIPDLPFPIGDGYWALTRHDDIWHVSRNAQLFCSGKGANIGDQPQEMNEFFGSMINMDDPRHFRLRSIVSKGFTPKEINAIESEFENLTEHIRVCPEHAGPECVTHDGDRCRAARLCTYLIGHEPTSQNRIHTQHRQ